MSVIARPLVSCAMVAYPRWDMIASLVRLCV